MVDTYIILLVDVFVYYLQLSKSNCQELLYQLLDTSDFTALNSKVLICLFWKLGESFIKLEPAHDASVGDAQP